MFFKMYFRSFFGETFLSDYELDSFLEIPLTVSDNKAKVPKELESLMLEILRNTATGSIP